MRKQAFLKKIRVFIAVLFILASSLVFLDFRNLLAEDYSGGILYLQFVPSLLKFISLLSLASVGFMVIMLLTALFGRVYCSAICPLGIFQDVITRISIWARKKFRFRFSKPANAWRYGFLALSVLVFLSGTVTVIGFLDPYSNFGRIFSDLFRPLVVSVNNLAASAMESVNVFWLYPHNLDPVPLASLVFPFLFLGMLIWMASVRGRLFCNTVCPVGALLGLISRIAPFRIRIDEQSCTACGKCAFVCKAECINFKRKEVDFSRCVSCYNCITVCPFNSIGYAPAFPSGKEQGDGPDMEKRGFLAGFAGLMGIGTASCIAGTKGTESLNEKPTTVEIHKEFPVSPPGSLGIEHYTGTCTACHLCVSICPTNVLRPSVTEFGLAGFMQPHMDYSTNYCNFECTACSEVCPTGAIMSLSVEDKKITQIGQVHFVKENCVVYTENTACGSCSEHCPTQAVRMIPYKGTLTIPEVDPDICVGCGACEYACPTIPFKAIYVDGNPVHQIAERPEDQELEQPDVEEDFPF